jgi:putative toxin-antitoxin system antitoxin component (TIGR02293 family)
LTKHGLAEQEIYELVLPRRTLAHRRAKHQPLTREESDKAVRLARITALAEQVFGDEEKASRWLRQPKRRFGSRTPLDLLSTEAGARLVEEMLYQIDDGMVA